jgi:hypothetical protein
LVAEERLVSIPAQEFGDEDQVTGAARDAGSTNGEAADALHPVFESPAA